MERLCATKRKGGLNCYLDPSLDLGWITDNAQRTALGDLDQIRGAINPHLVRPYSRIHVWNEKTAFHLDFFDNPELMPRAHRLQYEEFLGESHDDYMARYCRIQRSLGDVKLLLRLLEGSDPLNPIRLPDADFGLLNSVSLCGVDSTLATIDQLDDVLSIISADAHILDRGVDHHASRTDLYVLNPKLLCRTIQGKITKVEAREDVSREIGKSMRESEYALAFQYGMDSIIIMDGTLFGRDQALTNALVAKGIIFVCVVKNPVSRIVAEWYGDVFSQYGYEKVAIDAVAFNDMLPSGTRSPFIFAQMTSKPISWASKIFTYLKPAIPGTTVFRVEIPADYAYLADRLVDLVHCACLASGDPSNSTALPIVHAEYAAKSMLPDPYDIAENLRATLAADAMETRMQGSFNARRSMSESFGG